MPGRLVAFLTGRLEVRGCLGVLAPPYRSRTGSADRVGGQDAGVDGVADSGGVVAQFQGVFRSAQELAGLGEVGSGFRNAGRAYLASGPGISGGGRQVGEA